MKKKAKCKMCGKPAYQAPEAKGKYLCKKHYEARIASNIRRGGELFRKKAPKAGIPEDIKEIINSQEWKNCQAMIKRSQNLYITSDLLNETIDLYLLQKKRTYYKYLLQTHWTST